jgi:ADP-ribose pyrophosphatase YjhB (NUDIX family)/predicted transcriptional regulator
MQNTTLHQAQGAILYALRHGQELRFSELARASGLDSDAFKFHLRRLMDLTYIAKTAAGVYVLTPAGKEFANNLNQSATGVQKQPKLSVLLVVPRPGVASGASAGAESDAAEQEYLFQCRHRSPYYGFWSCIGGPLQWGEDAEETAARELHKQSGLRASFTVRAFYRKRDYTEDGALLEDKLFTVLEATDISGNLVPEWRGGRAAWMTLAEFNKQEKRFGSASEVIEMVRTGKMFASAEVTYPLEDY